MRNAAALLWTSERLRAYTPTRAASCQAMTLSPYLGNMFCEPPPTMSTPGFEPGLSRPQRDVLTTRRCGQQRSPARVALKICSLPGAVAAQGSRSRAWRAAGRRSAAEARGRLQFPVPHAQCSRPTRDIRSPARLHTDRCSKLPSDSLSPHLGNMFCEPPPTMSTPGFEPGLSRPQRDVLTTRR